MSREEKDEVFPRSLIMRGMLSGQWIEFGAGGFEPHELKASWCASETWCVPAGEHSWSLSLGQMLGGQGKRPRGGWHIATITRLRPNRMHSQLINAPPAPSSAAATKMVRAQAQPTRLFRTRSLGRKSHSSHEPLSQRAVCRVSSRWLRL
jgi:hypothetical protein